MAVDLSIRADIPSLPLALVVLSDRRIPTTSSSVDKKPDMSFGVVASFGFSSRGVTVFIISFVINSFFNEEEEDEIIIRIGHWGNDFTDRREGGRNED